MSSVSIHLLNSFFQTVNHKYDVGEIMDTWTRQMGFPVVTLKHIRPGVIRLEQSRFLLNPDDKFNPDTSPYR